MKGPLTGLIAAAHTPMHADSSINLDPIEKQAQMLAAGGLTGVFICGTTGEGMSLTVSERRQIAERWQAVAPENFPVMVNVSALSLEDCRALAAHAQKIGACAIAAMAPCFFKPASAEDLALFCAEIAAQAPNLPFYYYHIPDMTGVTIPVYGFLTVAGDRIPTLTGVKFTHEDLMDFERCLALEGGRFDMLYGRDQMLLSALVLGAKGAIGTTYNFAAPLFLDIMKAYEAGDIATARAEQARAAEMIEVLEKFGGLPACKAVMKMIGLDCGPPRLPQRTLSDQQFDRLYVELEDIGFPSFCLQPQA